MIPRFPNFKKLELSDKIEIELLASKYSPYSDFDFVNLFCWYGGENISWSILNDNLVISFNRGKEKRFTYSFLGEYKVNQTAKILLNHLESLGYNNPFLSYIPEISLNGLSMEDFLIEIDFDNSDYIYNINELAFYSDHRYSKKRQLANSFTHKYGNYQVKILDLYDLSIQNELLILYDAWSLKKNHNMAGTYINQERDSIHRFLNNKFDKTLCVGVFVNLNLVAYSIFRILNNGFAICYFAKVNTDFIGLNEFLMKMSASKLLLQNCNWLNYQEDMGIEGLRFSKNSFRPSHFLRKYTIKQL